MLSSWMYKCRCVCVCACLSWLGWVSLLRNFGHAMSCSRVKCVLQRYQDASGAKRVQGGPGLKQTQLYTPEFGRALASWWMAHGPVSAGTACCNNSEYHMLTAHSFTEHRCMPVNCRRERRRWCLVQSSNVSADIMKDCSFSMRFLCVFDFKSGSTERHSVEALQSTKINIYI